jgi:hypothetical protein
MSEPTLRQRRNLLLSSMVLIIFFHGQVEFVSEVKLLGTTLKVTNSDFIFPSLITLLLYFAYRFYQYFHVDEAYSVARSQYKALLKVKMHFIINQFVANNLPQGVNSHSYGVDYEKLVRTKPLDGKYPISVPYHENNTFETQNVELLLPASLFRFKKYPVILNFLIKKKIITDYYLPYLFGSYALVVNAL